MLISNMTILFSTSSPKIPKPGIFGSKFKDFYFASYFPRRQIRGRWLQIWQWFFQIPAWKYPNTPFFVLNISIFYFCMKLCILKNFRLLISKTAIVLFQIPAKNTQIRNFTPLFQPKIPKNSKNFFFLSETLSELNFITQT